jgi:cell wall-associated NlpC family hydrolase
VANVTDGAGETRADCRQPLLATVARVVVAGAVSGVLLAIGWPAVASADQRSATATTGVNIRSGPSTSYTIVGGLVRGQRITPTGPAANGWVPLRFDHTNAFMSAAYLDTHPVRPATPVIIDTAGTKIATATLNVRTGPGLGHRIIGTVAEGEHLVLTGTQIAGYAQTRIGGHQRWVSTTYLASTPAWGNTGSKGEVALAFARDQLGKPYRYGATGPDRYDCSGLVQAAWRTAGVALPRTSQQQYAAGVKITKAQLRIGDLVFFYGPHPHHVGLYAGDGTIINAPRPGKPVQYAKISSMPYAGATRPS